MKRMNSRERKPDIKNRDIVMLRCLVKLSLYILLRFRITDTNACIIPTRSNLQSGAC